MGLIDMLFPQTPLPSQNGAVQQQKPRGLLDMMGIDPNSTTFNVGAQLLANGLPTTKPFEMGRGIPEAIQNAQVMQGREQDMQQQEADRAEAAAIKAERAKFAMGTVDPDLKSLAQADPELALRIQESRAPAAPDYTSDQQNYLFAQGQGYSGSFADWVGGGAGGGATPPQIETRYNPETGQEEKVQWDAQQGWVPFGGQKQVSARDNPMNPTIQKEIFETDDAIIAGESAIGSLNRALELSKTAYDGPLADQRAGFGAVFGDKGAQDTQLLRNEVTSQALQQMKAIFGAAPTEGERAILLEIQGAANQTKPVRDEIYRRGIELANRRLAANKQKAAGLRNGDFFDASYGQQPSAPGAQVPSGNTTSGGVSWSIVP